MDCNVPDCPAKGYDFAREMTENGIKQPTVCPMGCEFKSWSIKMQEFLAF